jgi:uncharacterized protein YabN with tetrapyrrole methylase and pyrophosphatase domain
MKSGGEAFDELVERIARLRDPMGGCPWDRAQDHRSLRPYMLEEAYEAIAAVDSGDSQALCDELGDVLLQVVLHAQIASEAGKFDISHVIGGLCEKLVRRHPHVFGDASDDLEQIRRAWRDIKARENAHKHQLPALIEARKLVEQTEIGSAESVASGGEAEAGMRILRAVAAGCREGHEPELALRRAMEVVKTRTGDVCP